MKVRIAQTHIQNVSMDWPAPARPEAFAGLLGEFILEVSEHTEADPHSVLAHGLIFFGNILGRGPQGRVGETPHHLNLFAVVVGQTSSGRKGTARDLAWSMMSSVDDKWPPITTGLSSGEGLIHAVRDETRRPADPRKGEKAGTEVVVDRGVVDKRLPVVEPEFFGLLQTMKRAGNTLSPVIRQAWDGHTLQVASRNTAAKATAPHISIIGHITLDELLDSLDDTSLFNGFANRFLWVLAKRSRRLPEGGQIPQQKLLWFRARMHDVVVRAKKIGLMMRSERAKALWDEHYDRLSNDTRGGLLAAATARATALVLRLSCCYALLDGSAEVQVKHLRSALAFWDYCDASAQHIFGARVGQRHADKILKALRSRRAEGLTRSEIYDLVFHRHANRDDITRALARLAADNLARHETTSTAGRPEERWFVT